MAPSLPSSNMGSSGSTSRSLPSTLPSDPSEISATAQALLQVHYGRLKTRTTTSSSSPSSAMESQHAYLAKLEAAARNIDRICLQLDNLSLTQQLHKDATESATSARTIMQPLGPLAFWPARLVPSEQVFVRQDPDGLAAKDLLALEDEVLPMLTGVPKGGEGVRVNVRLTEPSRTIEVRYAKLRFKDAQSQLQVRKGKFVAEANKVRAQLRVNGQDGAARVKNGEDVHMVNEDNEVLNEEGLPFYEPVEQISEEEATRKKKAYMQPFVREEDGKTGDKKKRKQWLDDMLSKLEAEEEDEMDSDEEDGAVSKANDANASSTTPSDLDTKTSSSSSSSSSSLAAEEETRVVLRTRTPSPPPSPEDAAKLKALPEIVSAARPPPPKSALKASALRPAIVQRPSFGSAGIRHGFLNLNPSSPGAIKSSYSWEDLEKEDMPKSAPDSERPSRSHTPTPLSRNASLLSRVTDAANSSPMTSGTSTPTKKSVRIKSPERAHPEAAVGSGLTPLQRALRSSIRVKENYSEPAPSGASQQPSEAVTRSLDAGSGTAEKRHKDDVGVEEEAERIVRLLGPEVVEGHPAAPAPDVLKKMQEAHEEDKRYSTPEAVAARAKAEEEERERERLQRLAEKPALGHAVMERPRPTTTEDKGKGLATQVKAQAQQAKFSAFKAGFLNQKPTKFVPNTNVPRKSNATKATVTPPTQSLGMSALDRASLGDEELSERRQQMGLPAALPHARPSKAFAEKMKMRQEGILPDTRTEEEVGGEGKVKLARPVEGDDVPRAGRVRFGPPASSEAAMDEDEVGEESATEINPGARLENHLPDEVDDGRELDEEQEEPKIEGEGADTDEEDAYFDSYLSKKRSRAAAAASRGHMDDEGDEDDDEIDDDDEGDDDWDANDEESDEDEDDDFDYDREDLLDLAPALGATEGLSDNPELMREYEEARAKLAAMGLAMPGRSGAGGGADALRESMLAAAHAGGAEDEEEDDDYEMDVVPLDATMEDPEYQGNTTTSSASGSSRISRFKASLAQRKLAPPKTTTTTTTATTNSQNLEDLLSSAQNLGSSSTSAAFGMDGVEEKQEANAAMMIIPQLAPVRFPKNGDLIEGQTGNGPVDLDGVESDEDDEKAEMVMRSRLERQQWKRENPELAKRMKEEEKKREEEGQVAPQIGKGKKKTGEDTDGAAGGVEERMGKVEEKLKKVSRFKAARMGL